MFRLLPWKQVCGEKIHMFMNVCVPHAYELPLTTRRMLSKVNITHDSRSMACDSHDLRSSIFRRTATPRLLRRPLSLLFLAHAKVEAHVWPYSNKNRRWHLLQWAHGSVTEVLTWQGSGTKDCSQDWRYAHKGWDIISQDGVLKWYTFFYWANNQGLQSSILYSSREHP